MHIGMNEPLTYVLGPHGSSPNDSPHLSASHLPRGQLPSKILYKEIRNSVGSLILSFRFDEAGIAHSVRRLSEKFSA
jgi:hypothetical protein